MKFLLEIGTEELPAKDVWDAMAQLKKRVPESLQEYRLTFKSVQVYGTPRRLAVIVEGLSARQPDRTLEIKGPMVKVAIDASGTYLPAALGFAKGQGLPPEKLVRKTTEKGEFVFAVKLEKGRAASVVMAEAALSWIQGLEFTKSMRWEDETRFARPVRWIVACCDRVPVVFTYADVKSSMTSYGHRFLAPKPFRISTAGAYVKTLKKQKVMVDPVERDKAIKAMAQRTAKPTGQPVPLESLERELAQLVEWPDAVMGSFDEKFLTLPREVLIMVMEKQQRFFPVMGNSRALVPHFVVITNGTGKANVVRTGNERVIRARLTDAEFFYRTDQQKPLGLRVEDLKGVVWLEGLGTLFDKSERLMILVGALAEAMGISGQDREAALRAARLAKADQVTEMVKEFPELEGVMGAYYAKASGEPDLVVTALSELYWPRGDHRGWPESPAGILLNLAERLDHVAGCFVGGRLPTGSEDPYGARRQAVAIVQWALEKNLNAALHSLLAGHVNRFPSLPDGSGILNQLSEYFRQRVEAALLEQGMPYDLVRAVLTASWDPISETKRRVEALVQLRQGEDFKKTMVTFSRVTNILPKPLKADRSASSVDPERFQEEAERELYERYRYVSAEVQSLWKRGEYAGGFEMLKPLCPLIDNFFEKVMVMVEDKTIQSNRLHLLHQIHLLFLQFADFSQVVIS